MYRVPWDLKDPRDHLVILASRVLLDPQDLRENSVCLVCPVSRVTGERLEILDPRDLPERMVTMALTELTVCPVLMVATVLTEKLVL